MRFWPFEKKHGRALKPGKDAFESLRSSAKAAKIVKSRLLDLAFYNSQCAKPFRNAFLAARNFVEYGAAAGINPNSFFDTEWYRRTYLRDEGPDINPLLDFIDNGIRLNRNPSPRFNVAYYIDRYREKIKSSPLAHYLKSGQYEGCSPNETVEKIVETKLLDVEFYKSQTGICFHDACSAALHYNDIGAAEGMRPNAFFDTLWYTQTYPDVIRNKINPLVDFAGRAPTYDRNPSLNFDCAWYLSHYADVRRSGLNPLHHFLTDGQHEHRSSSAFVDSADVPVRYADLLADLSPLDGVLTTRKSFPVDAVPEDVRDYASFEGRDLFSVDSLEKHKPRYSISTKPYTANLRQIAVVGGTRLLLTENCRILSDEIASFWQSPMWAPRPHFISVNTEGFVTITLQRKYPSLIEQGIHLMHEYAYNYFHFVAEVIPKLLAVDELGISPNAPLIIQENLHPNLLNILKIANRNNRVLIEIKSTYIYKVESLQILSDFSHVQDVYERPRQPEETVLHAKLLSLLSRLVISACKQPSAHTRRRLIYARRGGGARTLVNEQQVEEVAIEHGFESISTGEMSLAAQVSLFRQAAVIIAPTGAALTNILWCMPGTLVCVLAARHIAMPVDVWEKLGDVAGCEVSVLYGMRTYERDDLYAIHDNYTIEVYEFEKKLLELAAISQRSQSNEVGP